MAPSLELKQVQETLGEQWKVEHHPDRNFAPWTAKSSGGGAVVADTPAELLAAAQSAHLMSPDNLDRVEARLKQADTLSKELANAYWEITQLVMGDYCGPYEPMAQEKIRLRNFSEGLYDTVRGSSLIRHQLGRDLETFVEEQRQEIEARRRPVTDADLAPDYRRQGHVIEEVKGAISYAWDGGSSVTVQVAGKPVASYGLTPPTEETFLRSVVERWGSAITGRL
jgi:hypothetical protein